ncbi:MAG: DUF1304 domain-containing protein [Nitrospinae bacterium]|nr:DUF1304 domain-containing protein [Nitrospinota bacterium]
MTTFSNLAVAIVALLHFYFFVLESFLWDKPIGMRTFRLSPEFAKASKSLAQNQGLYNLFLCAGLIWGLSLGPAGGRIKLFFLACVVVAGVVGAITANRKILLVQGAPGLVALLAVLAESK